MHELASIWGLVVGEPFEPGGQTAWVAPVRDRLGRDLVLKVGWAHQEGATRSRAAEPGDLLKLIAVRDTSQGQQTSGNQLMPEATTRGCEPETG